MKRKRLLVCAIVVVFALIIGICVAGFSLGNAEYVPYTEFQQSFDTDKIEDVEITKDKVFFHLQNDKTKYYTDHPNYDDFKLELLVKGIDVTDSFYKKDISIILADSVFYIIFGGIIIYGIYKLIDMRKKTFAIVRKTNVSFDDIAGMKKEKEDMAIILDMIKSPKKYAEKGIRPIKGIILEGPPGNGKTLFAKALAQEAGVNFIATKGADFQSAVMSIGPAKVKSLFRKAIKHSPCIIFIDEFDGIGEARNYAGAGVDKENNRMIISLLNEMDGFKANNGVLVIGATNSFNSLDEALVRPGRFDRKYTIPNPDFETIKELIKLYTKGIELDNEINADALAKSMDKLSCSAIATLINEARLEASTRELPKITQACIDEAYRKTKLNEQ